MAWVPYLLLVVFVLLWGDADIKPKSIIHRQHAARLRAGRRRAEGRGSSNRLLVPGLHNLITQMPPVIARPRRTAPCSS